MKKIFLIIVSMIIFGGGNIFGNPAHGECGHKYDPECAGCSQDCMSSEIKD